MQAMNATCAPHISVPDALDAKSQLPAVARMSSVSSTTRHLATATRHQFVKDGCQDLVLMVQPVHRSIMHADTMLNANQARSHRKSNQPAVSGDGCPAAQPAHDPAERRHTAAGRPAEGGC